MKKKQSTVFKIFPKTLNLIKISALTTKKVAKLLGLLSRQDIRYRTVLKSYQELPFAYRQIAAAGICRHRKACRRLGMPTLDYFSIKEIVDDAKKGRQVWKA